MARVRHIQKAQASTKTRRCRACGHEIQPGEPYKYVDKKTGPRSGHRLIWCQEHSPKPSDLASGRTADLMVMVEGFDATLTVTREIKDNRERMEALSGDLDGFIEEIEGFAQEIRDGAESIEDGFGHPTSQSEAMSETADAFDEWAEGVRQAQSEIDSRISNADEDEDEEGNYEEGEGPISDDEADDLFGQAEEALNQEPDLNLQG